MDALAGVEILIPNGEMSPNKVGNGQVPSISYSSVQNLGVGDPISHVRIFRIFVSTKILFSHSLCYSVSVTLFREEVIKVLHTIRAHTLHRTVLLNPKMDIRLNSTFFHLSILER